MRIDLQPKSYHLAAGRLLHYKRFDLIINVFNRLKTPLLIVGRGPEFSRLMRLNRSSRTCFLTDFLPDSILRQIYSNAHALIFPQIEDFGLIAAECLACGTPVASSNTSSLPEVAGDNATYFDPRDISDMVRAIKNAKSNHGPTQATKFSWAKAAAETLQVYQEALNKY